MRRPSKQEGGMRSERHKKVLLRQCERGDGCRPDAKTPSESYSELGASIVIREGKKQVVDVAAVSGQPKAYCVTSLLLASCHPLRCHDSRSTQCPRNNRQYKRGNSWSRAMSTLQYVRRNHTRLKRSEVVVLPIKCLPPAL
jgi:hypothetical protein